MKKIFIILPIIAIIGIIYLFFNYQTFNSYKKIEDYVIKNEQELLDIVEKKFAQEKVKNPLRIKNITVYDKSMVEFSTMSFINQYSGFYYSKNNIPLAFQNSNVELKEDSNNTWIWKADGDNKGKTIKIKDNWFYYEANL